MMPSNSPSATSSETSATIFAPPMSSPRLRVARTGGFVTQRSAEWVHRRLDVAGSHGLDPLRVPLAVRALRERGDEHRLDQRVVRLTDPRDSLRADELPALERGDHPVDVVAVRLLHGMTHHQREVEAVRSEEVGRM